MFYGSVFITKIFNCCEVPIENSVTRVTVWYHEACRVTEFSICTEEPLWILFLAYSSSTVAFRLEYVLFHQFYAKLTTFFDQGKFGTAPLLYVQDQDQDSYW